MPYAKAQSYKQCVFSPFRKDGSLITVQLVGRFSNSEQITEERKDNLSRKMEASIRNTEHLKLQTLMDESAVFQGIDPTQSQFHKFAKIVKDNDRLAGSDDNFDFSMVSFWAKNSDNKLQVLQPYTIPNTLSRVVNSSHDLHEVIFQSYNVALPFMFSQRSHSEELILNIL